MVIGFRNLEWLNHNSQRAYPLAAEATKRDTTDTFSLPDSFLVGLQFPVNYGLNVAFHKFFILRLLSHSTSYQLILGYSGNSGDIEVASTYIPRTTFQENSVYNLTGLGDFVDSRGAVVIGSLEGVDAQPAGAYEFELEATRLEPDAIRPNIRTIPSLEVQDGSNLSGRLSGRIRLRAGKNTRFRVVQELGADPVITWDAISGAGLTEDCVCDSDVATPIRTINLVAPDGAGNLNLLGTDCMSVSGGQNALVLKDLCSQPCCGCDELAAITSALEAFGARATTLENFLVSLEARVSQMDQVVLGSKLGDRGCTPATDCP